MTTSELTTHALVRTLEQLSSVTTTEELTALVTTGVRHLMAADGASFALRQGEHCVHVGEDAASPLWQGQALPLDACASGWVIRHRQRLVVRDARADARVPTDAHLGASVTSLCLVPVRATAPLGALGALGAWWREPTTPSAAQVRHLELLAAGVATTLENLELRRTVSQRQQQRDELELALHALVHDLRTPLTAVVACAELIGAETGPDAPLVHSLAERIVSTGQRLGGQIERMLDIYSTVNRPLQPDRVDVSALARELAEQRQAEREALRIEVEDGLEVAADPVLVQLVLENLIDNAVKFSSHRPEAVVEVSRADGPSTHTTFVVRDNGAGFEPAHVDRLFRPLSRLHPAEQFPGTGLGLASAARVVSQHGGTIRAEGEPDRGAAFYVSLPAPA